MWDMNIFSSDTEKVNKFKVSHRPNISSLGFTEFIVTGNILFESSVLEL